MQYQPSVIKRMCHVCGSVSMRGACVRAGGRAFVSVCAHVYKGLRSSSSLFSRSRSMPAQSYEQSGTQLSGD